MSIPKFSLIDLANSEHYSSYRQISYELVEALKKFGFVIIKDHGIPLKLIRDSYETAELFFSQTNDEKDKWESLQWPGQRGYVAFGKEKAKNNAVFDLKEFFHLGRQNLSKDDAALFPQNQWPSHENKIAEKINCFWTALYSSLDSLAIEILEAIGCGLDLRKDYFKERVQVGNSILRVIHYPALDLKNQKGALRAAPHEDINLITLMLAATDTGLEILDRDHNVWIPVLSDDGDLIVDTGDMMERITCGMIPSTTHRVINAQHGQETTKTRFSMPFFVHPHPLVTLEPIASCASQTGLTFDSISSDQFLKNRLKENGLLA